MKTFLVATLLILMVLFFIFIAALGIAFLHIISDLSNNEYEE